MDELLYAYQQKVEVLERIIKIKDEIISIKDEKIKETENLIEDLKRIIKDSMDQIDRVLEIANNRFFYGPN